MGIMFEVPRPFDGALLWVGTVMQSLHPRTTWCAVPQYIDVRNVDTHKNVKNAFFEKMEKPIQAFFNINGIQVVNTGTRWMDAMVLSTVNTARKRTSSTSAARRV